MARVTCIGCERILYVKTLEAYEGFAACPRCHALFDVTNDVVKRAPRNAAEFWSHGDLPKPPSVEAILQRNEEPSRKNGYRSNARSGTEAESILLTCSNQKLFIYRFVGPMMILVTGGSWLMLRRLDPTVETSVAMAASIILGLPMFAFIYLSFVGFLNRVRIHVDRTRLQIDQGPLPFPHKKIELPIITIARLCAHHSTWTGRNGVRKTIYSLTACLKTGLNATLLDALTNPAVAMFLQRRIATFLDLDSQKPVDLIEERPTKESNEESS